MDIIVDSISVDLPSIPPGGTARVTILAHDTSARELDLPGPGIDAATGEEVPMSVRVTLPGRPLTFRPVAPAQGTLTQDPFDPNVFIYTAPEGSDEP